VKFFVDNPLSPVMARLLNEAGHDAVHVRDYGMGAAPDEDVMARAVAEDRIVILADTDFGTLLATQGAIRPSVILFRRNQMRRPEQQVELLLANLEPLVPLLEQGHLIVFQDTRIRTRRLPMAMRGSTR
jgi:predicted nuclease of predicted toxin-antitoxin system